MARFSAVAIAMLLVLGAGVWVVWYVAGLAKLDEVAVTRLRMERLSVAVRQYVADHGAMPGGWGDLGPDPTDGKAYTVADGWGREIRLEVGAGGEWVLRSLGADGVEGGGAGGEVEDDVVKRLGLGGGTKSP